MIITVDMGERPLDVGGEVRAAISYEVSQFAREVVRESKEKIQAALRERTGAIVSSALKEIEGLDDTEIMSMWEED